MSENLKLNLDIDAKKAQAALKATAQGAKDLGADLDDTRTAGQKAADVIKSLADESVADFKAMAQAGDALALALGPEIVAGLDKAGSSVDELVSNLSRMGLSFEEIEADADVGEHFLGELPEGEFRRQVIADPIGRAGNADRNGRRCGFLDALGRKHGRPRLRFRATR